MTNISAVIITKDEEMNIERCISSMRSVADEIVVVDSSSTDRTQEICESLGAIFIQHEFKGYGAQKKFAVSQAKNDWILSLDADEVMSEELAASIKALKDDNLSDISTGYTFTRRNYYCGKLIRFYNFGYENKIRLFNRNQTNWSNNLVHEVVESKKLKQIEKLKGDLLHYTYNSVEQHEAKIANYGKLGAQEVTESGKSYNQLTIVLKTIYRFFSSYILKLGILDGYYGFKISQMDAKYVYMKYSGGKR